MPATPKLAILMTWLEASDAPEIRLRGTRQQASSLNAFTIANADREWFHVPSTNPPIGSGSLLPLAPAFLKGYGVEAVEPSQRRFKVAEWLESTKNRTLRDREKIIIT